MTKDDLIDRADKKYKTLCGQVDFIGKPTFIKFPLPTARRDINVIVEIRRSIIFEITVYHKDFSIEERIRP